jgi:hypothetical protein
MKRDEGSLAQFAEKVTSCCNLNTQKEAKKEPLSLKKGEKTIRLPTIAIPKQFSHDLCNSDSSPLEKPKSIRLKQMKSISVDLLYQAKPVTNHFRELYRSAIDAYQACQSQDLHLFRHQQVYCQNAAAVPKRVRGWKLPQQLMAAKCINESALSTKTQEQSEWSHGQIKKIEVGKAIPETEAQQIELHRQQLDKRPFNPSGL